MEDNHPIDTKFSAWPYHEFKRFKHFAETEAGGIYWVAVKLLLERNEELERMKLMYYGEEPQETEQDEQDEALTLRG